MSNWLKEMPADYYKRSPWAIAIELAIGAICGLGLLAVCGFVAWVLFQ